MHTYQLCWRYGTALVLWLLLAACSRDAARTAVDPADLARWEARAANVTILRDSWGIPHIYGTTDADTVFGTLYAQAEDDFNRVETNYINAMGRLAEAEGAQELMRDLRMKLFIDPAEMQTLYDESPVWLQELMVAFADGLNYYLYTHPEVRPRVITHFEPWMALTFTEGSIGGDIERVNLNRLEEFYGSAGSAARGAYSADTEPQPQSLLAQATTEQQAQNKPQSLLALQATAKQLPDGEPRGSNGFAIAPENSASGNALLLINPHTSFFFRAELHMVSEEGLNAYGAVTWGQFFVYQGFNENTGWMHTSSRADAIDEYLETVVERDDGYYYLYGDEERRLQETELTLPYRTGRGMAEQTFTVYHSHHGPIIREQDGKWVAIKLMEEPIRALTQSYTRTKARNYTEFNETMTLLTNSSNNTVYADSGGNIAYYHGNFIPVRDQSFDWNAPLDGSNQATEWKGLHPVDEIITLLNPPNGWIQNTNNTPFSAAAEFSPQPEDYPPYMANNPENYRGVHAVRVLEGVTDFTIDSLLTAAYDPLLTGFEELVPLLIVAAEQDDAGLSEYINHLRSWDYHWSLESTETTLAVYWGQALMNASREAANEQNINIYTFMAEHSTAATKLTALRDAAERLQTDFGDWRVPWGEVNRYQRLNGDLVQQFDDDAASIPVPFASGRWGSLASFGARTYPGTNRMYGTSGNSFVAAVEFGERLSAKAITVGGLNNKPTSTHFDDQAQMYADGEFRDVLFYREDIEANLETSYHPGEN
ncbi:MAG: penicillin acylase family protein [Pseudohongiellaceae bacterium]